MIYNVSHHYNTPERVASLLVKITNQVRAAPNSGANVTFCNCDGLDFKRSDFYSTIIIKLNEKHVPA
jgi:hypothetical protein